MSMDALGSAGVYQTHALFANYKQRSQELKSPAGSSPTDRPDAKKTFASFTQDLASGTQAPTATASLHDLHSADLTSLGHALQAGDLEGAQKAFAALQQGLHGSTSLTESLASAASRTFRVLA